MTKKELKTFKSDVQSDLNLVCEAQIVKFGDVTEGVLQDLHMVKVANEIIENNENLDIV